MINTKYSYKILILIQNINTKYMVSSTTIYYDYYYLIFNYYY